MSAHPVYSQDPLVDIKLGFPVSLRDAIDKAKGDQSRNQWIKEACTERLEGIEDTKAVLEWINGDSEDQP